MTEGLPILHAPFSRVIKHQMRMKMLSTRETFMKPHAPPRWSVRDDEGTAIAYTRDGVVYSASTGGRIAKLRLGQLCTADGQILGMLMPSGRVRGVGGEPA